MQKLDGKISRCPFNFPAPRQHGPPETPSPRVPRVQQELRPHGHSQASHQHGAFKAQAIRVRAVFNAVLRAVGAGPAPGLHPPQRQAQV